MSPFSLPALLVFLSVAAGPGVARAQDPHVGHAAEVPAAAAPMPLPARTGNDALPAGEEQAREALERSPRHGEFVDVKVPGGSQPVRAWVVYPERKGKAPVVIVIHEIFGLSDWIRAVADQLARDGFIAIAPDLLSGKGADAGGTETFASRDDVVKAVRGLDPAEVTTRLDAIRQYGTTLPAASGQSATVGFCWGGSTSFRYATTQPSLDAAVVFYGTSPDVATLASVRAPVLGLYGEDDARVNSTIEAAKTELGRLGRTYETELFAGAGHGFLRQQSGREGANQRATERAWPRAVEFLRAQTRQ